MVFSEIGVVWGQCFLTSFNCQSTTFLLTKFLWSCVLWLPPLSTPHCLQIFWLNMHSMLLCLCTANKSCPEWKEACKALLLTQGVCKVHFSDFKEKPIIAFSQGSQSPFCTRCLLLPGCYFWLWLLKQFPPQTTNTLPCSSFLQGPQVQYRGCHLPPALTLLSLLQKPLS